MTDHIEVDRMMPVGPRRAADVFWDIVGWQRVWDRINEVEVRYDDGQHQEFAMAVERDGRTEQVRTLRFRTGETAIDFFSPDPPPTMGFHRGQWRFASEEGGCRATAVRDYALLRGEDEDDAAYAARCAAYRERFEERLGRILDSFTDHFSSAGNAGDTTARRT